jgi:hypothetical protein
MGANTYRLMSGFAAGEPPAGQEEFGADEEASVDGLTQASNVVFSTSLEALLLLSRADQRSFTREHVDLSLIAEEATETLLPLAENAASPSRRRATRPPPSAHARSWCR